MAKVGEQIRKSVKGYCDIYDSTFDVPSLKDNARSIALHDPMLNKYIWEEVTKEVKKYIDRRES